MTHHFFLLTLKKAALNRVGKIGLVVPTSCVKCACVPSFTLQRHILIAQPIN
jgi:hypothetical protein